MNIARLSPDSHGTSGADRRLSEEDRSNLAQYALAEDRYGQPIDSSIGLLRHIGWLEAALPSSWGGKGLGEGGTAGHTDRSIACLMDCAEENLSAARLFEGHVNALGLLRRYADDELHDRVTALVREGGLLGVWGADDSDVVCIDRSTLHMSGSKRYTSGLGCVSHAVVTARGSDGTQLCLVDVREPERGSRDSWSMSGMRASASGRYCFDAIDPSRVSLFGEPDDFNKEPALVGGVWRIAALQLGGTFGLLESARAQLKHTNRLGDTAQLIRLTPLLYRATAARHLVAQAACLAESDEGLNNTERAVALSIFSRLLTEELGQDAVSQVERSVGLLHFHDDSRTGRQARDLSTYLRQVAPDAFLQRSGQDTLGSSDRLSDLFPS